VFDSAGLWKDSASPDGTVASVNHNKTFVYPLGGHPTTLVKLCNLPSPPGSVIFRDEKCVVLAAALHHETGEIQDTFYLISGSDPLQ
tara:strand:+ start:349 stop:609 length:261 start_codon:yes stop_codon:yes gene_type:complete